MLTSLSERIVVKTPQAKKEVARIEQLLSRSLEPEEAKQLKSSGFVFETADLFAKPIPFAEVELRPPSAEEAEPEFRAFVREIPVRSTQLHASMPLWASGAAVERTVGPLTSIDGRQLWFDFFRIERLVALYIQNKPEPVLLFKVRTGSQFISRALPLTVSPSTSYSLGAGSIWINSAILAANAPAGNYTGLTIRGGRITLSAPPQTLSGKLTVAPTTVVTVELDLQQAAVANPDPSSPYGIDARDSSLQLPERFAFHFSGTVRALDEITRARWDVFGHRASFEWDRAGVSVYDSVVHRVLIPFSCSERTFSITSSKSPLNTPRGRARIRNSAWALPSAPIDVANPTPASGTGAMLVRCDKGLATVWQGLTDGELNLIQPYVMAEPGRLSISDPTAQNSSAHQQFRLWKDELNTHGTTVELRYSETTPVFYFTFADGNEALMTSANADVRVDRPVTVAGEPVAIRSKNSLLIVSANKIARLVYLFDDNIVADNVDLTKKPSAFPKPIAIALRNALFKVTPVNGCVLFGSLKEDFIDITHGFLYLTFGMYAYVPTLPDPYAANLGVLQRQFHGREGGLTGRLMSSNVPTILMWLVCQITWEPTAVPANDPHDKLDVSFHFAPLQNQFQPLPAPPQTDVLSTLIPPAPSPDPAAPPQIPGQVAAVEAKDNKRDPLRDYGAAWDQSTRIFQQDAFALLDVSTNADLFGVSFGTFGDRRMLMMRTHDVATADQSLVGFPLRAKGMDIVSQGANVRAFTVPQISWEPVFNLTPPSVPGDPSAGFNYYPDDGGPTRILNTSSEQVALAPIPLTDFLVETYAKDDKFAALALFTLPFGMRALALLKKEFQTGTIKQTGTNLQNKPKKFDENLTGARQLELAAGKSPVQGESNMFVGCTIQENNVLEWDGSKFGNSTLGRSVTRIFNLEFMPKVPADILRPRGVPVTRLNLTGYGATMFSNWLNPKATIAATSQAKFDVLLGRCAHEIIQVRSLMYPWGIRVVRTITLLRTATNYVYRHDSGWQAESDGKFDFSYYVNKQIGTELVPTPKESPYEIHPGVINGLFNVKEIKETKDIAVFSGSLNLQPGEPYVDEDLGQEFNVPGPNQPSKYELQPVYFNADVEIENPVSGYVSKQIGGVDKKVVPSKGILGYVQLAPRGMPLPVKTFEALIASQQGSIGGPIDTLVNIAGSDQEMRLNRFDVSNSIDATGFTPVFAGTVRGNVILPKDGSWSLVKHENGTGTVNPVPQDLSVPLIRIGKLKKPKPLILSPTADLSEVFKIVSLDGDLVLEVKPATQLLRIANPTELLRSPVPSTINYGFLHSTDTQKVLFLTPSFANPLKKMISKTPPLFADAFRLANSKAAFPNIKDAVTNFGEAIALTRDTDGVEQFKPSGFSDGGQPAREIMEIQKAAELGYKLAKQGLPHFPLPDKWDLINIGNSFRIYIDYKAIGGDPAKLDFNIDPAAGWKSRMSNVSLVVDLGPFQPLMTIKGNWDAHKGAEAQFGGGGAKEVPNPQIVFSDKLQTVMDILEILQSLSGKDYAGAVGKGVRLAMSNKAGSWEYKFEASKEIPLLRFPPGLLYDSPQVPLKLEAGLKLGAYFNSALQIPTDKNQLLPSAGATFGFYGRLSVMCVSLEIATVYAVGQANLDFGADTKAGPFLRMKFGFGAQIVVGLPVLANVSVLYMVGVEIYLDSQTLEVSAFLLFSGHADLLSGLLSVTITIEAKGTVVRNQIEQSTSLAAQVTFALDITIFWVIDISIEETWGERRQIAGSKIL